MSEPNAHALTGALAQAIRDAYQQGLRDGAARGVADAQADAVERASAAVWAIVRDCENHCDDAYRHGLREYASKIREGAA